MLLPVLLRPSRCCARVSGILTQCVRTPSSPAGHFLLRPHSRGLKGGGRKSQSQEERWRSRNKTVLTYIAAAGVGMIGLTYASVPLYRLYCQVSSSSPLSVRGHASSPI